MFLGYPNFDNFYFIWTFQNVRQWKQEISASHWITAQKEGVSQPITENPGPAPRKNLIAYTDTVTNVGWK